MKVAPVHDEEVVTDPDCMAEQADSLICAAHRLFITNGCHLKLKSADLRRDQQESCASLNVV